MNARLRVATFTLLGCSLALGSTRARAHDALPARVAIDPRGCSAREAEMSETVGLLHIELGGRIARADEPVALRAELWCGQEDVRLTVAEGAHVRRSEQVELRATPRELRPRVLALALAELVRAVDEERAADSSVPPVTAPVAEPPRAAPPAVPRSHLGAFAQLSSFSRDGRWLGGAGLSYAYDFGHVSIGLDAAMAARSFSPALGEVRALWGYGAPHVAWLVRVRALRLTVGAGYALGAAGVRGRGRADASADRSRGFWCAPYAVLGVSFGITSSVALAAQASLGWVQAAVVGEVERGSDVAFGGLWTQLRAGIVISR